MKASSQAKLLIAGYTLAIAGLKMVQRLASTLRKSAQLLQFLSTAARRMLAQYGLTREWLMDAAFMALFTALFILALILA